MPPPALGSGFPIIRALVRSFLGIFMYNYAVPLSVTLVFLCLVLMLRVRRAVVSMCCCPFVVAPSSRSIAVVQCVAPVRYPHVITFNVVPCVGVPSPLCGWPLVVAVPSFALASLALPPVPASTEHPPGGESASPPPAIRLRRPRRSGSFRARPALRPSPRQFRSPADSTFAFHIPFATPTHSLGSGSR